MLAMASAHENEPSRDEWSPIYFRTWVTPETGRRHITAHNVGPKAAFSYELLKLADGGLEYDGETITLNVDNGRWVWKAVEVKHGVLHGRWPD